MTFRWREVYTTMSRPVFSQAHEKCFPSRFFSSAVWRHSWRISSICTKFNCYLWLIFHIVENAHDDYKLVCSTPGRDTSTQVYDVRSCFAQKWILLSPLIALDSHLFSRFTLFDDENDWVAALWLGAPCNFNFQWLWLWILITRACNISMNRIPC